MCFCKNRYVSRTLGGAVFKHLKYLRDMVLMIPTDVCADVSNGSKDIAIYDKSQNGGHGSANPGKIDILRFGMT